MTSIERRHLDIEAAFESGETIDRAHDAALVVLRRDPCAECKHGCDCNNQMIAQGDL